MSDAHELAARLRDLVGALEWDAPKHITQDIDSRVTAAAVELERLADENAQLRKADILLRAALVSVRKELRRMRSRPADAALDVIEYALASAGPPQEPSREYSPEEMEDNLRPADPPPERRCTCQRVMLMGREIARPRDPACPVHGR